MYFKRVILLGVLCLLYAVCTTPPASAADHYVVPTGTPQGDGSLSNPWDLQTALNQPASVNPGDTIWLRGGTYHASNASGFSSMINGTASSPVVVRNYNGEHVSLDGSGTGMVLAIYGSYTWFWGLEIADFSAQPTATPAVVAQGIGVYGPGIKCINMIVHDTAQGFSAYNAAPDSEFYGNLVYYNGFVSSTRNAGHGMYFQNNSGMKVVTDNFVGDNADEGMQIYGSGTADVVGFDIEGNSLYNTSSWPTVDYQYNIIIAGGTNRKNITYSNNFSYFPLASPQGYATFGQYTNGQDITIQNNIFAGGRQAVEVSDQSGPVSFTGNTLVAGNASLRLAVLDTFPSYSAYTWNNNTYYDQSSYQFYLNPSGNAGFYETFAAWRNTTGFDANSTYQTTAPTGVWVYVRPNKYEAKRANVTVYNWDQTPSVSVDLSSILSPGDSFVIQDAQNFYGLPVVQEIYQGGAVNIPMTGLTKATPIGFATPAHTAPQFGTFVVMPAASSSGVSAAAFLGFDTTTQGNWQGRYGTEGYSIANANQSLPGYAIFTPQNTLLWTWAASTTDVRALRRPNSSLGIASTWYNRPSFSYDVNFTDGNSHQIALYALDWDSPGGARSEMVQIVDASNPSHVLDTESLLVFTGGTYLVWNISGHVRINVTWTGGANAVISGVFFGVPPPTAPSITSVSGTTLTVGTAGTFTVTASGSPVPALSETGTLPSGVTFNASTGALSGTPTAGTGRSYPVTFTASNGVSPNATQSFTLTVNQGQAPAITSSSSTMFTVGAAGTFSVTATGSPTPALSQTGALPSGVTFNTSTGVLGGTPATGSSGSYPVTLTASNGVNPNATQNFTLTVNPPSANGTGATFVGSDTITQGNWQGKYGTDGYSIANSAQSLPVYATFAPQNILLYTWAASTSDVRALRMPNSSQRIASTWYNNPTFSYDVNLTDGNTHQIALYALDWDSPGGARSETVQIVDANNPSHVLDTEALPSCTGGTYLVWNISGHVTINVTRTGGANAVISGIFFGVPPQTGPAITSPSSTTFTVGSLGNFTVTTAGNPTPVLGELGALPSGVTFNFSTGVLSGTPATGTNGSYPLTFMASNGVNPSATQSFTLAVNSASAGGSSVTFVGFDKSTQGNWQGKYGADGYSIANYAQSLPSYASFTPQNALVYTWTANTSDVRALRLPNSSAGFASTWYNSPSFSYDVNITDGNTHQIALYALDWDSPGGARAETISIVDANNPSNVLDSESVTNCQNGMYLVWKISGHVKINVTLTGGANAVLSGVFFGSSATASFVTADATTQGSWPGKYGVEGYAIANAGQSIPNYAVFAAQNQLNYTWTASTSDVRALKLPNSSLGIASTWYNNPTFNFDINVTDGNVHQIALYALDWDGQGVRAETVSIVDANSPSNVLDSESVSNYQNGVYLVWKVSGHVKINLTRTAGANAVISGIFFK